MAESWAKVEHDFLTSDEFLKYPVGARMLYINLWAYAHSQRRQIIRRPSNTWLADHFKLKRHPIGDYLQALDEDGLIILTDSTIELPGLHKKHYRYKYKDAHLSDSRSREKGKPKGRGQTKAKKKSEDNKAKLQSKPKKKASRDAEHETAGTKAKRLVDYFFEAYKEKRGTRYRVVGKRDMNIFKLLLSADDEGTIKRAIDKFLSLNGDRYLDENGYSVPAFKSRYQGIIESLGQKDERAPLSGGGERLRGTE